MPRDVAVVVVNYNSAGYTVACVRSVLERTSDEVDYEVIVVDNNSAPGDFRKLLELRSWPRVRLLRSRMNLGFAGGNMLGVKQTRARHYLFLNSDCILLNDCLTVLLAFCRSHPHTGLCAPQVYSESLKPVRSFDRFPTLSRKLLGDDLAGFLFHRITPDPPALPRERAKVDTVTGSAMFVTSAAFSAAGGFDTSYFLYCEEEDLALTLSRLGYEVYLVPEARCQHYGGRSTGDRKETKREFYISFLLLYRKHYGRLKTQVLKLLLFLKALRKALRDPEHASLALFILRGAPASHSMRHRQTASSDHGDCLTE